ncbi:MAG: gamma-glutamylcyclotransferase [Alphaproteobacteria bacterium]|nr:gamma-glutamylcyclotransferase [Alphaproteobacteria bacterium]
MPRLFFYGTLMDADLRLAIAGCEMTVEPAWLDGFRCVPVAGADYPMLVASPRHRVEGLLTQDIGKRVLGRLIRYEGGEYRLEKRTVRVASGRLTEAGVFFTRPGIRGRLHQDWDLSLWQRRHKGRFLNRMPAA